MFMQEAGLFLSFREQWKIKLVIKSTRNQMDEMLCEINTYFNMK